MEKPRNQLRVRPRQQNFQHAAHTPFHSLKAATHLSHAPAVAGWGKNFVTSRCTSSEGMLGEWRLARHQRKPAKQPARSVGVGIG